jgi:DNA-binding PadR family transcriptional regulator
VKGKLRIMSLKYVVLGLLAQRPKHGYELKLEAERLLGGNAELNPGQLYPLLRKLAEQHLIAGERIEQEDRPDKRVFTLTEGGSHDLGQWLEEPLPPKVERTSTFIRFVVLALVRRDQVPAFLQSQRRLLLEFIGRLVADRVERQKGDDLATNALREATILHAEADLKWIDWLEAMLRDAAAQ